MKNKKLLVVCQHFWPEEFKVNEICYEFVKKGYDVEVICGLPNYPSGRFFPGYGYFGKRKETHNGVKIRRCFEIRRGNNSLFRLFFNYLSALLSSLLKLPYLLTQKYDRVFIYQLTPITMALIGIIISKIKRIPSIMYVLDVWPENIFSVIKFKNKIIRNFILYLSCWYYKKVDKIISYSNNARILLKGRSGLSEKDIICIPQSCEKFHEQELRDNLLIERFSSNFNIVFTGNINPAQSFETIIEAAKRIRDDGIIDIRWIIVGDGMSLGWLRKEVDKERLSTFFIFEGMKPITQVPAYAFIADCMIACLRKVEGYNFAIPAKVMSYFAAGRPLILAIDGEIKDIVNENQCGYASEAENTEELYKNIKKIYVRSREERIAMGKRSKEYHLANFEWDKNFEKLERFVFE
jgi:glycosyltransferase involved in cell wall biosynthesis